MLLRKTQIGRQRKGLTLVEVAVVLAIVAILAALLIPAIVKAREAGVQTQSRNNLKQLMTGVHNFAGQNNGQLPPVHGFPDLERQMSWCLAILPYIEQNDSLFLSPADPYFSPANERLLCSYPANGMVFTRGSKFPGSISDGVSETIGLAEHYSRCGKYEFVIWAYMGEAGDLLSPSCGVPPAFGGGLVRPVTSGNPPVSESNHAQYHLTFQIAPAPQDCDPFVPQTPHRSGMLCAFMDGSVHTLGPSISPATFWGAVTPAGGEQIEIDP